MHSRDIRWIDIVKIWKGAAAKYRPKKCRVNVKMNKSEIETTPTSSADGTRSVPHPHILLKRREKKISKESQIRDRESKKLGESEGEEKGREETSTHSVLLRDLLLVLLLLDLDLAREVILHESASETEKTLVSFLWESENER